jgi:hypothetical protein
MSTAGLWAVHAAAADYSGAVRSFLETVEVNLETDGYFFRMNV